MRLASATNVSTVYCSVVDMLPPIWWWSAGDRPWPVTASVHAVERAPWRLAGKDLQGDGGGSVERLAAFREVDVDAIALAHVDRGGGCAVGGQHGQRHGHVAK